jgi:hypothetical protein
VAQVFLGDDEWAGVLRDIRRALSDEGHLAFETRRPDCRAWEEWALDTKPVVRNLPEVGHVEQRRTLTQVDLPHVSFRYRYTFARDGCVVTSCSTIRFRSGDEVEESLCDAGYDVLEVRDAPDRPGREYVFLARRRK